MRKQLKNKSTEDIAPDEIFLDDRNIPGFDVQQFEGRIEVPIERRAVFLASAFFVLIGLVFLGRAGMLQLGEGAAYAAKSEENRLEHQLLFPERGIIYDRRGTQLAWNEPSPEELGFSLRAYINTPGFAHVLGFLHYPARDKHGVYYRKDYEAPAGIEQYYNDLLKGKTGLRIIETDALGNVRSSNVIDPPIEGNDLHLAIDARIEAKFSEIIGRVAREEDYLGGAGAIMDIESGEMLALVSYPEYDPNVMTSGDDAEAIAKWNSDTRTPFLNRAISGLYTPGSIVKPMFAIGALNEGILTPDTRIESRGYIAIPNPYIIDEETRFNDWKAHGWLDMRTAIAQSSNVYFYEVAGGYKGQKGLGIARVEQYARLFGYGSTTGIDLYGEQSGTVPNPDWKAKNFPDDPTWRIGDTYFTGIGQYGMQTTLLQALREAATISSKGTVVLPRLALSTATSSYRLPIPESYFTVIQEGMRKSAVEGTASLLNIPGLKIAAKTGTAELGTAKTRVNSWVIGFFPYDKPKYAFAVVMDRGVRGNTTNASYVAQQLFWYMLADTPEYLKVSE
ncbi:MAG: penicillin-binding transpeptidase domain-containing protein [bacterium]|nr:penicillin-binding transpeptidase domain-containing protein [bacterium]